MDNELGRFLRSRRARLTPSEVGLDDFGGQRRVPGLRREELAQLAGVSAGYYTRLEQGVSSNASDGVLSALANVLRLDDDERMHLFTLASGSRGKGNRRSRAERLRPSLRSLLKSVANLPAVIIGRGTDVLAWNPLGHALIAGHLPLDAPEHPALRPNIARMLFLDPHTRDLYADWRHKAEDTVAGLHQTAARYPHDRALAELIGELTMNSSEFAAMWNARPVRTCSFYRREFHHPLVGRMTLANETLSLPDDDGQLLGLFYAEPGSASEPALRLLAQLVHDPATTRSTSRLELAAEPSRARP